MYKNKNYTPEDLVKTNEYNALVEATAAAFNSAISQEVPNELKRYLEQDVFVFSGLKTHAQLTEARSFLKGKNGNIIPYYQFEQKVLKLNQAYNKNYLEAEYLFAQQSSQSAANWSNLQEDTDRYWLQYRTADDDRVRSSHETLHNTTLPKEDAFWLEFYPPNGWRCRCIAIEVLARKYKKSDEVKALNNGRVATTQIGKNGKNKLAMFRFNPGKQKKVFPPKNTYTKVVGANKIKERLKNEPRIKILKETKDVNTYFSSFAKKHTHYFSRGFKSLVITSERGVNGFTDMNGKIALTSKIMEEVKGGLNNILKKTKTTLSQETALSTIHHEIMHNANKIGYVPMTKLQVRYMELANEFVSRNRLPNFMKALGGKLENKELMSNRSNTGYNTMVRNYDYLIKVSNANKVSVLEGVEKHLLSEKYSIQSKGLSDAISNNSKLNKKSTALLLKKALIYSEKEYVNYIEKNKDLITKNK